MAASLHGNTPYSGKRVTSGSVTPYTTSVDVNVILSACEVPLARRRRASPSLGVALGRPGHPRTRVPGEAAEGWPRCRAACRASSLRPIRGDSCPARTSLGKAEKFFHDRRTQELRINDTSASVRSEIDEGLGKVCLASNVGLDGDAIGIEQP